ncbi:MAG: ATP-binding protein [Syntrophobacterales bacterium]|nr:ATP-binding protein [Syntrophobacterales bacterium]
MFESAIIAQNSHWQETGAEVGIPRDVLDKVKNYLDIPHIIFVVGVRRAGKSTLMQQVIQLLIREKGVAPRNIFFFNLETPVLSRFRNDIRILDRLFEDYLKLTAPEGLIYMLLDEVQFFPEWQVFVKSRYEQQGIKFVVTGSNSRLLSSEFMTLLSGRTLPVEIFPFSFSEYIRAKGLAISDHLAAVRAETRLRGLMDVYLREGGFPETAFIASPALKNEILVMYARTILYQDIAPRFSIKKPADLDDLFFYLLANTANLFSYNRLGNLLGLHDKTVKEYISFFSDARLLFAVNAFSYSPRQQIRSPKKIYAVDTGLPGAAGFSFAENTGRLLENLVFLSLKRRGEDIFYYRSAGGAEVDFLCWDGQKITALIQVSWDMTADATRTREIKALRRAMEETGLREGLIVTHEEEEEIRDRETTIRVIPAFKFLLEE